MKKTDVFECVCVCDMWEWIHWMNRSLDEMATEKQPMKSGLGAFLPCPQRRAQRVMFLIGDGCCYLENGGFCRKQNWCLNGCIKQWWHLTGKWKALRKMMIFKWSTIVFDKKPLVYVTKRMVLYEKNGCFWVRVCVCATCGNGFPQVLPRKQRDIDLKTEAGKHFAQNVCK